MKSEAFEVPSAGQVNLLVFMNPIFIGTEGAKVLGGILPSFDKLGVHSVQLFFVKANETDPRFTGLFPQADFPRLNFQDDFQSTRIDWALVFGGDGALLWAHKALMHQPHVVYFSVKTGNLGVLTSFELSDLPKMIESMAQVVHGHPESSGLVTNRHHRLRGTIYDTHRQILRQFVAVNELVLSRVTNYCPKFALRVNGVPLLKVSADGLIVCTALGSTAYNSSVGGPTLMSHLPNCVLSAIAPFGVNFRPLVFGATDVLSICVDPNSFNKDFNAIQDGNNESRVKEGESLEVKLENTPELRLAAFVCNFQEEWGQKIQQIFKWEI